MTHTIIHLGLIIVFGIVLLPVYLMIAAWILGPPRDFRTVGIGLASVFGLIIGMIIVTWVAGQVIWFIMQF